MAVPEAPQKVLEDALSYPSKLHKKYFRPQCQGFAHSKQRRCLKQARYLGYCLQHQSQNISSGEYQCGVILKELLPSYPFVKARPEWLRNITGRKMELDWYSEELGLGVEYNGEGHYKWIREFHHYYDSFLKLQARDQLKVKLCSEKGIYLIVIPYTTANLRTTLQLELQKYIIHLRTKISPPTNGPSQGPSETNS